ncbi:TNT domain-containing protein [Streptomyces sp. NPDC001339]|uniref:TNT domain-containing protein n=1 Tax=Streptomyces sp. NPDC001339 TaxID=3364563 RepID=UPI0036BCBC09
MRVSTVLATAVCGALLGGAAPTGTAQAAPGRQQTTAPTQCLDPYLSGNWDLGPKQLPGTGPVAPLVKGYDRIKGATTAKEFFAKWKKDNWDWAYPGNDGFDGIPRTVTLKPGTILDRFGSPKGSFLSPVANQNPDLYQARSIPPSNLHTYPNDVECNYHRYRVNKEFTVQQGRIAAWFGQAGGGTQVKLGGETKVADLLNSKSLEEITLGGPAAPRHAAPRPSALAARPVTVTDRATARAELRRAGVPDDSYRIDGLHEPGVQATEYYRLRKAAGQWVLTFTERGRTTLAGRYADESRAVQRLFKELSES